GKGLSVNLGKGANTFDVNAVTLLSDGSISAVAGGGLGEGQAFIFKTGIGEIHGALTLKTTTGSYTDFEIGDSADDYLSVSKGMTLQSAGGEDIVILRGDMDIGGLLALRLGQGDNSVITTNVDQLYAKALTYTGGKGNDEFILEARETVLDGNFTFSAGAGDNTLDLATSEYLGVGGNLIFRGGNGLDHLFVTGPEVYVGKVISMNASSSDVVLGNNVFGLNATVADLGGIKYSGGAGTDIVDIGQFDGDSDLISVFGAVTVNTGTGSSDVQVRDADIRGSLRITTNAGFGQVDTIQLLDSDFRGAVNINMQGRADSDVVVRDGVFDRNVTVNTGAGDDYIQFDTDTEVSSIYTYFDGYVRVFMGAGNDVFLAGHNPAVDTVGNDFNGFLDVYGGSGYDRAYFIDSEAYNNGFNGGDPWVFQMEEYY
ncbi:MAG: hypothetical protein OJI67_04275, partial [Prosthecobacter sp.]|nr:hypothetical protein [Prosthecobacter sp.]